MKIAFLTLSAAWGGAEVHTLRLVRTLAARGSQPLIVQFGHDVYGSLLRRCPEGASIFSLDLPKPMPAMGYRDWRRLLRNVPGEVGVLVKGAFVSGSLALDLAARRRFARYVSIEHFLTRPLPKVPPGRHAGGLVRGLGLWQYRWRGQAFLRSLGPHQVICVSDAIRNRLLRDYFFPCRKVVTVRNGADPDRFRPDAACRDIVRRAWGITDGGLVFGAIGRLAPEKGYDLAVKLLARFRATAPAANARLVLIGEGPEERALKALAERHGLGDAVLFPGFSDRPWEALCGLDVFLMPSWTEGLPLALCEAMASGRACIAMGVGGVREVLTDPGLGWLVPSGDSEMFFAAMVAAARMAPQARAEMGRRARSHIQTHFDERKQLNALAEILDGKSCPRMPRSSVRIEDRLLTE